MYSNVCRLIAFIEPYIEKDETADAIRAEKRRKEAKEARLHYIKQAVNSLYRGEDEYYYETDEEIDEQVW
ncbi:unnamed protein product [Schistosoma margrebowiei]|uniref:Uncharacterized protein n=1 Tax=Schistosoma margrebowiei TaxID=48269 RepID=A0AA85AGW4_9TREM|nr:unnamed protein product [Schistosoma margrebowiei]